MTEEELLKEYMGIIYYLARKYSNPYFGEEDMVQEGMIAAIIAIRNYKSCKGAEIKTHMTNMVVHKMLNIIRNEKCRLGLLYRKNRESKWRILRGNQITISLCELSEQGFESAVPSHENRVLNHEALYQAIGKVDYKKIEFLLDYVNHKNIELSLITGKSQQALANMARRYRNDLKKMLIKNGVEGVF